MSVDELTFYLAGHTAPPGRYRRLGAHNGRDVVLDRPDFLPASLDGHVAVYQRVEPWRRACAEPRTTSATATSRRRASKD